MALTNQQIMNTAWCDWGAGAASSALGLLSFGIAGAASWLYYHCVSNNTSESLTCSVILSPYAHYSF